MKILSLFSFIVIVLSCGERSSDKETIGGDEQPFEKTTYTLDGSLNDKMEINGQAIESLKQLKSSYKFGPEKKSLKFPVGYVGLLPKEYRTLANNTMNLSIMRLIILIKTNPNPSKKQVLDEFKRGLNSFYNIASDTEDRERVCEYYSDIMDIIGLDSSNQLLNNWLY